MGGFDCLILVTLLKVRFYFGRRGHGKKATSKTVGSELVESELAEMSGCKERDMRVYSSGLSNSYSQWKPVFPEPYSMGRTSVSFTPASIRNELSEVMIHGVRRRSV